MTLSEKYPDLMLPVKAIRLTQGETAIIDPEDWELVSQHSWYAQFSSYTYYAYTSVRQSDTSKRKRQKNIGMHTFITGYALTDHHNGIGLDNRRKNLRPATHAQNMMNSHIRSDNTSRHVGVGWIDRLGKWRTIIQHRHVGLYANYDSAVEAYHTAAARHFGEFAPLCCPVPRERHNTFHAGKDRQSS